MSTPLLNSDPTLTLKSTPPRAIRGFLDRERLKLDRVELSGSRITSLLAPTGFGRTSQLGRWCRDGLARGSLAFWYSVDERDEPLRLVQGLAHCARSASRKLQRPSMCSACRRLSRLVPRPAQVSSIQHRAKLARNTAILRWQPPTSIWSGAHRSTRSG